MTVHKPSDGTIYVHYPCFDGLVSAAIASDFLETAKGWSIKSVQPVNYDRSPTWLETPLAPFTAIVDFLYHPVATFWADHHPTTFLTEAAKLDYEQNGVGRMLHYDRSSPSCGMLLYRVLEPQLSAPKRFGEMALWADHIDGAQYDSVQEAIFGTSAAMTISLSLAHANNVAEPGPVAEAEADQEYCEFLLAALRGSTLDGVASLPIVRSRADKIRSETQAGLDLLRDKISDEPGEIAVARFEPESGVIVSRYSPYYWRPDARYSVTLARSQKGTTIRAMRNPWRNFESVQLGQIFQQYGGGGHQRVGALVIPPDRDVDAEEIISKIVQDIRAQDAATAGARARA